MDHAFALVYLRAITVEFDLVQALAARRRLWPIGGGQRLYESGKRHPARARRLAHNPQRRRVEPVHVLLLRANERLPPHAGSMKR
jgi:hypothetical protein